MTPLQQPLFEMPAAPERTDTVRALAPAAGSAAFAPASPAPASPPPDARALREVTPDAEAGVRPAQQLWVAVQSDDWPGTEANAAPGTIPSAINALVRRAQGFTPRVAVESSDALLMEIAGSRRLFGGLPDLLKALRVAFPRPLRLALAPTPLAAVLLARAGANCCILSEARLKGRLAPLPLAHLRWREEEVRRLTSMGVRTLAELLRLPRAGLARRLGPERLWQLDRLTGARADPRTPLAQVETFHERIDPDYETMDRDRLLAALRPALERLEVHLRARQRGVMALRVKLHHRHSDTVQCLLRCVVPEYRAARFEALLAARLESVSLREPVRRLEFTAGRPRRFNATSGPLWAAGEQGGAAAAGAAPEFLQTLLARLGEHAVYGLKEIDEHRPERQQQRVPAAEAQLEQPARQGRLAGRQAGFIQPGVPRPLALLEQPLLLDAHRDAAGHVRSLRHDGRELALLSGPERIESGWWDGAAIARDYYVARATDGGRWWIYRECDPPRRWFLHGCFA